MTTETTTQETTTPTTPAPQGVPTPTKAELRAQELRVKREAKQAEKDARKAVNAEKRANGVIGTLHQMLQVPSGCSKREVLAVLTQKFADRDPIGMATTVGIQLSRLQKKHGKIVSRKQGDRGLVYGYETTVKFAQEGSNGVVAPTPTPVQEPTPDPVVHVDAFADGHRVTHASGKKVDHPTPAKGGKGGKKDKGGKK